MCGGAKFLVGLVVSEMDWNNGTGIFRGDGIILLWPERGTWFICGPGHIDERLEYWGLFEENDNVCSFGARLKRWNYRAL